MNISFSRRRALSAGLALGASVWMPPVRACEFYTPQLRVTHPWTRATAPGTDWAMVCMKFDEVVEADRLVLVEMPLASGAEMGGAGAGPTVDFAIPAGEETFLDESGTYVKLVGMKEPLEIGRAYPLRLGFEKGGVYNAMVTVDYTRFK